MGKDRRLPTFQAGGSLSVELGAKKLNDFVNFVQSINPVAGRGIRLVKTEAGTIIELDNRTDIIIQGEDHYSMGECYLASNIFSASGGGLNGPWGGVSDQGIQHNTGDQPNNLPPFTTAISASADFYSRSYIPRLSTTTNPDHPFGIFAEGVRFNFLEGELNANAAWEWLDGQEGVAATKKYSPRDSPLYINDTPSTDDQTLIYEIGQFYGPVYRELRFDPFGKLEQVGSQAVAARFAMAGLPFYTLGSTIYGSRIDGPGSTEGYWGGWRDKSASATALGTDTWNVQRQPQEYDFNGTVQTAPLLQTLGTKYLPIRRIPSVISGGSDTYYQRELTIDCRGGIHEIGQEELLQISGGGGGSSLLPLNIYGAVASGGSMYVYAYNGTFGGNTPNAAGNEVPTITEGGVAVRIDHVPPPKLSIPSGTKLVYLRVNVNTGGYVLNSLYDTTSNINPPANTTGTLYVRIATIAASTNELVTITEPQNVRGSQSYELCGGAQHLYALS